MTELSTRCWQPPSRRSGPVQSRSPRSWSAPRARADSREGRTAVTDLGVGEIPLGDDAAARLATLRAETALRMPDCCVLLATEDARAEAVLTFDDRLARAAERRRLRVV